MSDDTPLEHVSTDFGEQDATVLGNPLALSAEQFPTGLTPRELASVLQGQLLDHFHLQQFIGGGGMGVVFKSLDTTLDRMVAVKVLATHALDHEDLQRRFLVEAQSTARLDHPNIARIHLVGRDRGLSYIVFEYIEGVNIRDLVNSQGPLSLDAALSFTYQIAHALSHAWQRDVVHRDIKPSNILVTREGQAKLVDMGLARLYQENLAEHELTSTGVTLGTFDYISPEQARDPREADTRSDIYSLGCTLFFMLVGRAPFHEGTAVQKLLQHQGERPPSVHGLRPEIPESLDKLLQRMLSKLPEDRPQNPAQLAGELTSLAERLGIGLPPSLVSTPIVARQPVGLSWKSHLPWAIPLACLLGGVAATSEWTLKPVGQVAFPPLVRVEKEPSAPATVESEDPSPVISEPSLPQNVPIQGPANADQSDTTFDVEVLLDAMRQGSSVVEDPTWVTPPQDLVVEPGEVTTPFPKLDSE